MARQRLSMKYVEGLIKNYNDTKGLKYRDKGYIYLIGTCGSYQLLQLVEQGHTGVRMLEGGTLKDCYDKFIRL